jgi:hypothetical protein
MFAWLLRALLLTVRQRQEYNQLVFDNLTTTSNRGEATIIRFGFTNSDGETYTSNGLDGVTNLLWAILAICGSTCFFTIRFALQAVRLLRR